MADAGAPGTVDDIAGRAGLNARYVREWLGVMMSGGVVELRRDENGEALYFLPPEHAACLTGAGGRSNLGVYTQEIPLLTTLAMEAVVEGFRNGQGVPYTNYPKFQTFMNELSVAKHERLLMGRFIPSVDEGQLAERLTRGIRVLDLGCGEGTALILLARAFPQSRFIGLDVDRAPLDEGQKRADALGLGNIAFMALDAATLGDKPDLAETFDYVMAFDAIHDQTAPDRALRGVRHVLAPGGIFSMVDIAAETDHEGNREHPMGSFLYTVSLMHCLPVGLCDRGMGLGMMWGRRRAVEMLKEAGFRDIEVLEMDYDPFNYHFLCRKR